MHWQIGCLYQSAGAGERTDLLEVSHPVEKQYSAVQNIWKLWLQVCITALKHKVLSPGTKIKQDPVSLILSPKPYCPGPMWWTKAGTFWSQGIATALHNLLEDNNLCHLKEEAPREWLEEELLWFPGGNCSFAPVGGPVVHYRCVGRKEITRSYNFSSGTGWRITARTRTVEASQNFITVLEIFHQVSVPFFLSRTVCRSVLIVR